MKDNFIKKPANQDEIDLYCFVGEALWKTQVVEQALSHSITLKLNSTVTKKEADEFLKKQQGYTLGKAVNLGDKEKLYSATLQADLYGFLDKRNWLVHKAMHESMDDFYEESKKELLFKKIKSISNDAERMQHEIELDLIDFCEARGKNMSGARQIINSRYGNPETK